ncbi:MAG TPA: galactose-1-phosphate uridylyltransferase, partial [Acholeplasmataceae bacterium]|nr:galactose-1-phosphate uridylyltransferase [Acholeplasmataceae bacterium]
MRQAIENLIHFEITKGVIQDRDVHYVRNQLYYLLKCEMMDDLPKPKQIDYPSDALEDILNQLENKNILDGSKISRDLMDAKIMNVFAKLPSDIEKEFYNRYQQEQASATSWYYHYMQSLNYIRMDRILKNLSFSADTSYGMLDITINMSKPEKDPKSIILAGQTKSSDYPKCLLCAENEGFAGHYTRDSRDNHRIISTTLGHDTYYFQYSPYIYYNEHAIVLSEIHRPMVINHQTFSNLLNLCDQFEGYFFGSNADLPIVGGSILSHDHYQGGKHVFPIEKASVIKSWKKDEITYELLKWPLSTLRMKGT